MDAALNGPLGRTVLGPEVLRLGRAQDNLLVILLIALIFFVSQSPPLS